jgi:hypothetical protein
VFSWRKGARANLKNVVVALHREGLRGEALLAEAERMIPKWRYLFGNQISRAALLQRADKAHRYKNEAPENHLQGWAHCWPAAQKDAKRRKKWTLPALRAKYPD